MRKINKTVNIDMITDSLKKESQVFKKEVQTRTLGYIMAGLGLVSGLAWNDAIKAAIVYLFPNQDKNGLVAQFVYAIVLTGVVVIASVYLTRLFQPTEDETEKKEEESE